ncbi:MAG TPA: MFS transporter [Candidatus Limnocylindrales bacterium]|jgi:fucose permease
MAGRAEVVAVYGAGLIQGVALVTFPAASSILTSPSYYGLTNTAYGTLFLPQAIAAISAALAGARLTRRSGVKQVFLAGLVGDLAAMTLLVLSQFAIGAGPLPYLMLLAATTSLGIGFGLAVPSLNNLAAAFFPAGVDRAVLYLNALLGLGTALAPVLIAVFLGIGLWWGLPLLVAILIAVLLATASGLPLQAAISPAATDGSARPGLPQAFWLFAGFAVLYGIVETTSGNWATLYMTGSVGASSAIASLALTVFWAMVTLGRVVFAAIEARFPETSTYRLLPFVAAVALALVALLPTGDAGLGVVAFGLAGVGCSALLPLTISFGQRDLAVVGAALSGLLIATYQMGYGIAAFGFGPVQDVGVSLSAIFALAAAIAVGMGVLSLVIVRRQRPASSIA